MKNDKNRKGGFFADIGLRRITDQRGQMEKIEPPQLPEKFLQASESDPKAIFAPVDKIDSEAKLSAELAKYRKRYAGFLMDLAPEQPSVRSSHRLKEFQWRLETESDRADFSYTQNGSGDWEKVEVPHYGGPIGRAVAWYRTSFVLTREMFDKGAIFVRFGAVDYKAHVFVNGHYLGSHEGFFAPFEFECSGCAREGENVLLVKVENDAVFLGNDPWGPDEEGDKLYAATGLGWDDPFCGWKHCPPGFGICQDVFIEARGPMHISDLWVRPMPADETAEAWIEISSIDRGRRSALVEISVFGQNFEETVVEKLVCRPGARIIPGLGDLQKPSDNKDVDLLIGPGQNLLKLSLPIRQPRLWEPQNPWLYQIQIKLLDADGHVVDTAKRQFGMRSFSQDVESIPRGRLFLNGHEIKLRGANTMGFEQQDVFKKDYSQLIDDILLAKICNMNFLRLTQRPVEPQVYEYCDRLGLMTQTDLPLFGCLRFNKFAEAVKQAGEMERLVRGYACNVIDSYINEPFPNAKGKPHRHLNRIELEAFFTAADNLVRVHNPDRVIKHVDGDYDPPSETLPDNHCYCSWYNGHGLELGRFHRGFWMPIKKGWNYACGEFGTEGLDSADLMRRRYPESWLPQGKESEWSPDLIRGCQTGKFHFMWFDTQDTLEDWVRESRRHQTWATRIFAERFRRDNRVVSFAIHLFIDAFPAGWMKAIMDCERRPKPAFFAYRDALEPLTANVRTDRWKYFAGEEMSFEFWVCNDTLDAPQDMMLRWQIEQNGDVVFAQQTPARIESVKAVFQGFFAPQAPKVSQRTPFTLRLSLGHKETAVEYEVFPELSAAPECRIEALGNSRLLGELGVNAVPDNPDVYLISDYTAYSRRRNSIDLAVANGARAVFLELPTGRYEIGDMAVRVEDCLMRARQFVSRATGHPLVEALHKDDFKFWYDPDNGYFSPLLKTLFKADDWLPILRGGNGEWGGGAWKPMLAAGEARHGKGSFIVCQVSLAGRVRHNPTAALFARRLLKLE